MLSAKWFLQNKETLISSWMKRNFSFNFQRLEELDAKRLKLIEQSEQIQARRNSIAKEIGILKSQKQDAEHLMEESNCIKENLPEILLELSQIEEKISETL